MKLILKLWLENCAQKNYDILFWSSFLVEKRTVLEKHGRIFASCREGISHSTSGFNFYFHVYSFTVYTNKNIYIQFSVNLENMKHGFTQCGLDILQGLT